MAFNTVGVGGGLDPAYIFSSLLRDTENPSGVEVCGLSGALRPQLAAQRVASVISYKLRVFLTGPRACVRLDAPLIPLDRISQGGV